eukprot:TRINITY_DN11102_c0_g1_i4.p2 TRINITY_DN11102_c0_g1~~TRINITY_DN11102_c0_g1_i4.p2  ORF type:complete len:229 (+),score=110.98 TRINITY_DN11102_c0_g1_i4:1332-2018(+)
MRFFAAILLAAVAASAQLTPAGPAPGTCDPPGVPVQHVVTTNSTMTFANEPIATETWRWYKFAGLFSQDELAFDFSPVAGTGTDAEIMLCIISTSAIIDNDNACVTYCFKEAMALSDIHNTASVATPSSFFLGTDPIYVGIWTTRATDNAAIGFSIAQYPDKSPPPLIPHASNTPVPHKPKGGSKGVSAGLAAFLFFLGAGVGAAAIFGAVWFSRKRKAGGGGGYTTF